MMALVAFFGRETHGVNNANCKQFIEEITVDRLDLGKRLTVLLRSSTIGFMTLF